MVRFQSISKAFPGVQALQDVDFDVADGSVHGLCGENGAGKSTLLKILSGVYLPDAGQIEIGGQAHRFKSTWDALDAGVAVIYQELNLVPDMSVAENVWLGHLAHRGPFVDRQQLARLTTDALARVGLGVNPWTRLGSLSLAQKQMVEIAKALSREATTIAFDEPTSSLSSREVETLFQVIADLKARGMAILYVSHRMDEITSMCDACTVLRDGRHVETFPTMAGIEATTIVNRMVGRDVPISRDETGRELGSDMLVAKGVQGPGLRQAVDLTVKAGEIVGVFGLVGAGRTELLKAIYEGAIGEVRVDDRRVPVGPLGSIQTGLVFCPEDRKKEGIVPTMSVAENVNLSVRRHLSKLGVWLDRGAESDNADDFIARLRIKTASKSTPISNLSGGNQQKAILARWLGESVKAILLDEPTRGIDVGAKAEIYAIVRDLARQGVAVLFVSSELPEILALSDRILVMCEGRVAGEMPAKDATEQNLLSLALPPPIAAGASL